MSAYQKGRFCLIRYMLYQTSCNMAATGLTVLFVATILVRCRGQKLGPELFKNPGMEDADIIGAYGPAWGYTVEWTRDSHSGSYAVKISNRYLLFIIKTFSSTEPKAHR